MLNISSSCSIFCFQYTTMAGREVRTFRNCIEFRIRAISMAAPISNKIAIKEIFETMARCSFTSPRTYNNARPAFTCMILLLWFNCTLRTIQLGIMTWRLMHNYPTNNCLPGNVVRNLTILRFSDKEPWKRRLTPHIFVWCWIHCIFQIVSFFLFVKISLFPE